MPVNWLLNLYFYDPQYSVYFLGMKWDNNEICRERKKEILNHQRNKISSRLVVNRLLNYNHVNEAFCVLLFRNQTERDKLWNLRFNLGKSIEFHAHQRTPIFLVELIHCSPIAAFLYNQQKQKIIIGLLNYTFPSF